MFILRELGGNFAEIFILKMAAGEIAQIWRSADVRHWAGMGRWWRGTIHTKCQEWGFCYREFAAGNETNISNREKTVMAGRTDQLGAAGHLCGGETQGYGITAVA